MMSEEQIKDAMADARAQLETAKGDMAFIQMSIASSLIALTGLLDRLSRTGQALEIRDVGE